MCFAAHIVRAYCRSVSTMRDEVAKVTLESQCYCCSVQHRDPVSGKDMEICDRRILRRCVVEWFGSVESFEHRVQHEVLDVLTDQLSNNIFSYHRIAEASSVFMAFFFDNAGTSCRDGVLDECTERLLKGVAYWLTSVPSMVAVSYRVAWALQRQRIHRVLDMLVSLAVLLSAALTACSYVAFDICLVWIIPQDNMLRTAIFVPVSAAITGVVWRCLPVLDGTRLAAAQALERLPGGVLQPYLKDLVSKALCDGDPETRQAAVAAIAKADADRVVSDCSGELLELLSHQHAGVRACTALVFRDLKEKGLFGASEVAKLLEDTAEDLSWLPLHMGGVRGREPCERSSELLSENVVTMADKFLSWLAVVVACVILLAHAGITISESSGWVLEDLEDVWRVLTTDFHADPLAEMTLRILFYEGCTSKPRCAAVVALGAMCSQDHAAAVQELLDDGDWEVRASTLEALASYSTSDPDLVERIASLLDDDTYAVRSRACYWLGRAVKALGNLGDAAATYAYDVANLLVSDSSGKVRGAAARALAAQGEHGKPYISAIAMLLMDVDPEARSEACRALGKMGASGLAYSQELEQVAKDYLLHPPEVKAAAKEALEQLGHWQAITPEAPIPTVVKAAIESTPIAELRLQKVHVGSHEERARQMEACSFVVAPFSALRVHCSVRPSGITKTRVLRQVGANQHWPYGLVGDEKSYARQVGANQHWPYGLVGDEKSYARQVDGNFFADVKNSSFFLKVLKEDAGEKQVDADAHLKTVRLNAKKFMQGNTIVDRESFIQSLTDAIFEDGLLTLVLGGKSVGKSVVVSYVAEQVRQAPHGNRTILLVNMRQMPADDFYEATLSVASKQTNVLDILTQRFIQQLPFMSTLLGAWRAGMAAAAAPLATSVQNALASLNDRAKAECLAQLVNDIKKKGNNTAIIIDEANLALPTDGNNAKAETAKTALAQITGETKEAFTASVVLISSEHGYPFKLANAGLNLADIQDVIIAPEVPPNDMRPVLSAGHYIRAGHRQLHDKG
eukprot:s910_g14.t2